MNEMNGTGLCLAQPGEPPATMEMMAIVSVGSGRLVTLYGPKSSVVWLPQGRELPPAVNGDEELTVVLGLTRKVGTKNDFVLRVIFFLTQRRKKTFKSNSTNWPRYMSYEN